jgi:hypothetical protein
LQHETPYSHTREQQYAQLAYLRQKSRGRSTITNNIAPGATFKSSRTTTFAPAGAEEAGIETINAANLLDTLTQLEGKLEVMAKTVNEKIQLFIASVSIRDSK